MRTRWQGMGVNLGLLSVSVAATLGLAELALRAFYPAPDRYHVLRPNIQRITNPDTTIVSGVRGPSRYAVNAQGMRGRLIAEGNSDEYRILAIGGSTTEMLIVDEPRSWPFLVEHDLSTARHRNVWVGNVGRAGANSRDHVLHMKYLLRQYPGIDAVTVLAGVNDFTEALGRGSEYQLPVSITDPRAEAAHIPWAFAVIPSSIDQPLYPGPSAVYKHTAVYQVLARSKIYLLNRFSQNGLAQDPRLTFLLSWRANRASAPLILEQLPDLSTALFEYRRNLNYLVDLAELQSVRLLFLTQPALWRDSMTTQEQRLLWLGGASPDFMQVPGRNYYSVRALKAGMQMYNDVMRDVARERSIELVDLAALVPADTLMFYDDVHFTDAGSRTVADELVRYLQAHPPFASDAVDIGTAVSRAPHRSSRD